jgi:GGDEF domain-containing protein
VRRADVVCRSGGAEFIVYMGCIRPQEAKSGATRLHRMIASTPVPTPRGPLPARISVVPAAENWPQDEAEPEAILAALVAAARRALAARHLLPSL